MKIFLSILFLYIIVNHAFAQTRGEIKIVDGLRKEIIQKENLGPNINSEYSEYVPVISHDGKTLYFFIEDHPNNIGSDRGDIWFSQLLADGTWSERQNIGNVLNNEEDNFVFSASPDNNTLFISRIFTQIGNEIIDGGEGFSIAIKKTGGWNIPKKLNVTNYLNKSKFSEFYITTDQKTLFLAIEGKDSRGKQDLYISFLQDNGTWSEPQNLGDGVNTKFSENSPFLAADGITLYFSTDGRPGFGKNDIFMCKRKDQTWKNWTEPRNLGPSINSDETDSYFSVQASGEYAYLVSGKNSFGQADIFRIKLPDVLKPEPVILIYGKVLNSETQQPEEAEITYRQLETDKEAGKAISNPKDGSYTIILPAGTRYSFFARKKDRITVSDNIDATKIDNYEEIQINLFLAPIKEGAVVQLNNLFFDTGKSIIKPESDPELLRLTELLKNNPLMKIEISGHTDITGTARINEILSKERAEAVKKYLVAKGINQQRLQTKGYSYTVPQGDNKTMEGRRLNRRVDFKILSK